MPAPFNDVNAQYPQNMWDGVTTNQRPWYESALYNAFVQGAVYNQFVKQEFNHSGVKAQDMYVDAILMPHADHTPLGFDQAWVDTSYMDSFRRKITFKHYGGGMKLNRASELVSHWTLNGQAGLVPIIQQGLGSLITDTLEKVARDAFADLPFKYFGPTGAGSSFNSIGTGDLATASMIKDIQLGLDYREHAHSNITDPRYAEVVCVTSPSVIDDIRNEEAASGTRKDTFITVQQYTDQSARLKGEVGMLYGVRFVKSPRAVLWNAGAIVAQTTITAPREGGDGAPDPSTTAVDGVEYVGQPGALHSLTVGDTTGFAVGNIVTIHKLRTSAFGVTNGQDYRDGAAQTLRIVAITGTTGGTIAFDRPLKSNFTTDLGSGVYGYITKGRNIHMSTFVYGPDAVVRGVAVPPTVMTPPSFDDLLKFQRFTWETYQGMVPFNKNAGEVAFTAGNVRVKGGKFVQ